MNIEFTIDMFEQKKDLLFVAGISLTDLAVDDTFTELHQYGTSKKSKKILGEVSLIVQSIIVDGEPVENLTKNSAGMIALSGDFSSIETHAQTLKWRKKSGRYIRSSDTALTLADS